MAKLGKLLVVDQADSNLIMRADEGRAGEVAFGTNKADAGGNKLFTDRVNRRICYCAKSCLK